MGTFQILGRAAERDLPDARLVDVMRRTAAKSPYNVVMFSGYRPGDSRLHGGKIATDVYLVDPNTGIALPNLKSAYGFAPMEEFAQLARATQQEVYPKLNDTFRWGGYFSGGEGKYGAVDLMHFDLGPTWKMAGGDWENGLTANQAKIISRMGYGKLYSDKGQFDYATYALGGTEKVKEFQRANGLEPDGIVGRLTTAALVKSGFQPGQTQVASAAPPVSQAEADWRAASGYPSGIDAAKTTEIQTDLAERGFYDGPIDGKWTPAVETAINTFAVSPERQEMDAAAAAETAAPTATAAAATDPEVQAVAGVLYAEARGEDPEGMQSVANVMVNRLNSGKYGSSLTDVLTTPNNKQFAAAAQPNPNDPAEMAAYQRALAYAQQAKDGTLEDITGGSKYFYNPKTAEADAMADIDRATAGGTRLEKGNHVFLATAADAAAAAGTAPPTALASLEDPGRIDVPERPVPELAFAPPEDVNIPGTVQPAVETRSLPAAATPPPEMNREISEAIDEVERRQGHPTTFAQQQTITRNIIRAYEEATPSPASPVDARTKDDTYKPFAPITRESVVQSVAPFAPITAPPPARASVVQSVPEAESYTPFTRLSPEQVAGYDAWRATPERQSVVQSVAPATPPPSAPPEAREKDSAVGSWMAKRATPPTPPPRPGFGPPGETTKFFPGQPGKMGAPYPYTPAPGFEKSDAFAPPPLVGEHIVAPQPVEDIGAVEPASAVTPLPDPTAITVGMGEAFQPGRTMAPIGSAASVVPEETFKDQYGTGGFTYTDPWSTSPDDRLSIEPSALSTVDAGPLVVPDDTPTYNAPASGTAPAAAPAPAVTNVTEAREGGGGFFGKGLFGRLASSFGGEQKFTPGGTSGTMPGGYSYVHGTGIQGENSTQFTRDGRTYTYTDQQSNWGQPSIGGWSS
jgi:spore germination cell wall hydrolase CwlJ-like protein